jgi:hypothetical protein
VSSSRWYQGGCSSIALKAGRSCCTMHHRPASLDQEPAVALGALNAAGAAGQGCCAVTVGPHRSISPRYRTGKGERWGLAGKRRTRQQIFSSIRSRVSPRAPKQTTPTSCSCMLISGPLTQVSPHVMSQPDLPRVKKEITTSNGCKTARQAKLTVARESNDRRCCVSAVALKRRVG